LLYQPREATGKRLKNIREGAGLTATEAVRACNALAKSLGVELKFTLKKVRRFEEIGLSDRYGTTPPSYMELHIMMRVYEGSLGYLIYGIHPINYPIEEYERLIEGFTGPEMQAHISWLNSLSKEKRSKILTLLREVAS